jgi:hypothetical protein
MRPGVRLWPPMQLRVRVWLPRYPRPQLRLQVRLTVVGPGASPRARHLLSRLNPNPPAPLQFEVRR